MDFEKNSRVAEKWMLTVPRRVDLEVSRLPLTLKRVANLIIAVERLKTSTSESVLSSDFQDDDLLSIKRGRDVEDDSTIERITLPPQFTSKGELECSITDSQKRSLVLVQSSMELHAVMLQGGSDDRKVHLNMSTYAHPTPIAETRPVALGIKDTNLYLSCHNDNETPTLRLEEVPDKDSLSRISAESDMTRFLFYKRDTGLSISTLMSARYPNWYISTAQDDNQVVEVCEETVPRHRSFHIELQS